MSYNLAVKSAKQYLTGSFSLLNINLGPQCNDCGRIISCRTSWTGMLTCHGERHSQNVFLVLARLTDGCPRKKLKSAWCFFDACRLRYNADIIFWQVYHYAHNYTFTEMDLVGTLQIPTFFLLSGFCLTLSIDPISLLISIVYFLQRIWISIKVLENFRVLLYPFFPRLSYLSSRECNWSFWMAALSAFNF